MTETFVVTKEQAAKVAAVHAAAERIVEAKQAVTEARDGYRLALAAAVDAGVSLTVLGRELGVTRQRVKRIIDGD